MIIAIDFDQPDLAELAFADDPIAGLDQVGRATALGAHLNDPPMLARRGQHGLGLGHIHADRLLDVDIGPGLHGGDHRQGVPVVGRGDQDDIEVFLLEHLAVVGVGPRFLFRGLARRDDFGGLGQHLLVDVAQGDDLDRGHLEEPEQIDLAIPARADQPDSLRPGCGECRGRGRLARTRKDQPARSRPDLEEFATIHDLAPRLSGWW